MSLKSILSFQEKAKSFLLEGKNTLLAGQSGCGKTRVALEAITQKILAEQNRHLVTKYLKNTSLDDLFTTETTTETIKGKHGALILVPTKELTLQVYSQLRELDADLSIHRTLSMCNLVGITKYFRSPKVSAELLHKQAFVNSADSVDWNKLDVVISSPKVMNDILTYKAAFDNHINPNIVLLDECDSLLQ